MGVLVNPATVPNPCKRWHMKPSKLTTRFDSLHPLHPARVVRGQVLDLNSSCSMAWPVAPAFRSTLQHPFCLQKTLLPHAFESGGIIRACRPPVPSSLARSWRTSGFPRIPSEFREWVPGTKFYKCPRTPANSSRCYRLQPADSFQFPDGLLPSAQPAFARKSNGDRRQRRHGRPADATGKFDRRKNAHIRCERLRRRLCGRRLHVPCSRCREPSSAAAFSAKSSARRVPA